MENNFVRLLFEERKNLQNKIEAIDILIGEYQESKLSTFIGKESLKSESSENDSLENVTQFIPLERIILDKFPICDDLNKWHKLIIPKQIQEYLKKENFPLMSSQKIRKLMEGLGYISKAKYNQNCFAILETKQIASEEPKTKQKDFFSEKALIERILFAFDSLGKDITYPQVANFLLTTQEMDKKEGSSFSKRIGRIICKMELDGLLRQTGLKGKTLTYSKV